jgi:hypothetical protein
VDEHEDVHLRLPERPLRRVPGCAWLVTMATVEAVLTDLRVQDQTLAFSLAVTGDAGGTVAPMMVVYDAAGTERDRTDLGTMDAGQTWEASLDLPVAKLEDGDYGAWVFITTTASDGQTGPYVEQGISFLVGRGRVYPSGEHPDKPVFNTPPTLSAPRLEGSWVVFDMTNHETFDVEVYHQMAIGIAESGNMQTFHGQELLRATATQQGHYLLPEDLADGRYLILITVQDEGSSYEAPGVAEIQVNGTVVTLLSSS